MILVPAGDTKAQLVAQLAGDLAAETADLMAIVSGLGGADWDAATPAAGWSVTGDAAAAWIAIAQAYAGRPAGPRPSAGPRPPATARELLP